MFFLYPMRPGKKKFSLPPPEPEMSLDQTTPLSSAAAYYQEETKYSRTTIHRFRSLDYSKKPPQFKDFQSESPISLVPFLPFTHIPFTRTPIPTPSPQPPTPWGLADLSRLLFFSYGVTAIMDSPKIDKTYMRERSASPQGVGGCGVGVGMGVRVKGMWVKGRKGTRLMGLSDWKSLNWGGFFE